MGNYTLAEELLTAAIAECGRNGPSFELLKKRATAREKLARGQPAADNGVVYIYTQQPHSSAVNEQLFGGLLC